MTKLLFLDLEMNQPSGSIIQVGACVCDPTDMSIAEKLRIYVALPDGEELSPEISKLTRIKPEQLILGSTVREALDAVVDMRKRHDASMNPYTWGGGDGVELCKQAGVEMDGTNFGRRWNDVKTFYLMHRLANGETMQGGLAKAMTKFGLAFEGTRHDALDDSINTFRILMEMLKPLRRP